MRTSGYHAYMKYITRLSTQQSRLRSNSNNILLTSRYCGTFSNARYHWKTTKNVPLTPANGVDVNVKWDLFAKVNKDDILKLINKFSEQPEVTIEAARIGLDSKLFEEATLSFREYCMNSKDLPEELHVIFGDILQGATHVTDILPYFRQHVDQNFPHLKYKEELKTLSDLQKPCNWYPETRKNKRKLIFHAGPTNSGKTYSALERFMNSKSGVYCGPLKLLSVEVFNKTNEKGTPCDLVTGEERKMVLPDDTPANHVACTIEMVNVDEKKYEVAVIDEIQMLRDHNRGWAWTRALLGIRAEEIHICGEVAAIDLVKELASSCGEELEVRKYQRLTDLTIEDNALRDLSKVQPGDCIVCFNKKDIFSVSLALEKKGFECAVIYGGLPPGAKLAQAKKFNDPNHPCKILVATDAIGMGLNLSIRRVIFYSLTKPVINEEGEKEIGQISSSQALQIGGRAGRYKTHFSEGFVTTFHDRDLPILKSIMSEKVEKLQKAGLHPDADKIYSFGYYLPNESLSELIDIFKSLCVMSTSYFMCDTEGFQFLAKMIEKIELGFHVRYKFCLAPINTKQKLVCSMFKTFAEQYSLNKPLTSKQLCKLIKAPFPLPQKIQDLEEQEAVYDVLDLYLWLSHHFPEIFPDVQAVHKFQHQLDENIRQGVSIVTSLSKPVGTEAEDDKLVDFRPSSLKSAVSSSNDIDSDDMEFGNGQVTQEVLQKGKITPDELKEIHKEWEQTSKKSRSPFNPLKSKRSYVRTGRDNKKLPKIVY